MLDGLANVGNTILGGLGSLGETLGNFFKDLLTGIIDGLKNLFIPTNNPFDELKEIFYSKMPIIQDIELAVNGTIAMLEETHEPKFSLQFTGQYGLNGNVATLNLSPYEPYREVVKNIIKALLWLSTLVYIEKTIPKMLGGVSYDS